LSEDPFTNYVSANDKGSLIKGIVKSVDAKAAIITLADDVEGTLKASEISRDKIEDARNAIKEGDEITAKISSVDRKNRVINLSVKAKDSDEEKAAVKEHSAKQTEQSTPATIGDLIKAQMKSQDEQ